MSGLSIIDAVEAIPPGASCCGAFADGVEFIDVNLDQAHLLARAYCDSCLVVDECGDLGDLGAPYRGGSVFGGHYYAPHARTSVPLLRRSA